MPYADPADRRAHDRNSPLVRAGARRNYLAHREDRLAYQAIYRKEYRSRPGVREQGLAQASEWMARRCDDGCRVPIEVYHQLRSLPCVSCGQTPSRGVDHILPFARGGHHREENLQPMCGLCNKKKGRA
jgi:5-methylcytosine-specific restriction endonuclease McrA